ncbi:MAG: KamA family radical SAM protein [bacterium]
MKHNPTRRGVASLLSQPEVPVEEAEPPSTGADQVGPARACSNVVTAAELSELQRPAVEPAAEGAAPNPRTERFRLAHWPQATAQQWNDWRWQWRNRVRTATELARIVRLSADEEAAVGAQGRGLPLSITPYYASLLDPDDPGQPLRRTVVPTAAELVTAPGETGDPLAEDADSPVPGLVHRYPDRVLFLVTGACAVYCRYCTRSRLVGGRRHCFGPANWEAALDYIARTHQVRDVLLSGGDPLTMPGERLEWLLGRLQAIPHVEVVRIGTKVPVVLPQRVTAALCRMLRRHHPVWMSIHFTHPDELTPETAQACARLADAGVPLGSQTVLLKGVNDDVATLRRLFTTLMRIRVRPYYLYQCDPIAGSAHFRTPVARGIEMIRGLRGHISGYAVPHYVVDAPGGGGKIPLLPQYTAGREGGDLVLVNYEGRQFRYPDRAAD